MPYAVLNSVLSVTIVSAVSLAGIVVIFFNDKYLRNIVFALVSLSVGVLFGDVLLHILPDLYKQSANPVLSSVLIFCGILLFFIIEKYLHSEHAHGFHEYEDPHGHDNNKKALGPTILAADTLHNFLDGLIITASFLAGARIGLATTLAVVFHEIPHEIGNVGVLLHAGYSKKRAFTYNVLTALAAFLGLAAAIFFGGTTPGFTNAALAVAAGGFIYIAGSELVPELHKESRIKHSFAQLVFILIGFGAMFAVFAFE